MKAKKEMFDLLSLLKVFDVSYVSDEDCQKLHGLNVNDPADVSRAASALLLPEFHTYIPSAQARLTALLRSLLANASEDFGPLFERVELAFDDEVTNTRAFMTALLDSIAATQAT